MSSFIFGVGFPGNILVIVILSNVRNYRSTPCTFYFLILSILNSIFLLLVIIPCISISAFDINLSIISPAYCKIQALLTIIISLTTISLECLTIVDQFLVTSRNLRLRNWSTIKIARRLLYIIAVTCTLHGIPACIYYDVIDSSTGKICDNTNPTLSMYYEWFFYLIPFTSLPISIFIIFGFLTYRNMRTLIIRRQQYQYNRQFTKLVSIQISIILVSVLPYTIYHMYILSKTNALKSLEQLNVHLLISTIVTIVINIKYSGNFYIFLVASKRFRNDLTKFVCRRQKIAPINVNLVVK